MLTMFLNNLGFVGQRLKYGIESLHAPTFNVTMAASTVLTVASSYFVSFDASGNAALTGAASTFISGHLINAFAQTTSSTAGRTKLGCTSATDVIFRVPVGSGTYSRANRGLLCDLVVASNVQGAAVQVSTRGHVRLLDGDETNNKWVIVQINSAKLTGGNAA